MAEAHVAVASLGGTITMTSTGLGGVMPTLTAEDLLASVPGLGGVADLVTRTIATKSGSSLVLADILAALEWARTQVIGGARGAVLIQGTDTIEETAYLLDLYWDRPEPLVVTGAMRSPQAAGADGPGNLLAAIRVAAAQASRCRGVLVVLNDQVHAACRVVKARSSGVDAFSSGSLGCLGYIEEGIVMYRSVPERWEPLELPEDPQDPLVALLETHFGDRGELLELVLDSSFRGVVVSAFGAGSVSAPFAALIARGTANMPVIFASRTGAGTTYQSTYGYPGSGSDLLEKGAVPSGWLNPRKARILLGRLIDAGYDRKIIQSEFALRGAACPHGGDSPKRFSG